MTRNIIKPVFSFKEQLQQSYHSIFSGVKMFDLERRHLAYGRIDKAGNAIYLDSSVLEPIPGVRTHWAPDFVADAFSDFRRRVKTIANSNLIDKNSLYRSSLRAHKAWEHGDLEARYNSYINNLYTNFVGEYLSLNRRHEKIKNFKDFTREFMRYCLRIAYYFPLTKTGYILSTHCSPFVSGLMVEVASERHGVQNRGKIVSYINDPNFKFFVNEAKKFGFMVDKNAPWRLVFNIYSGVLDKQTDEVLTGAQKYMGRYAATAENIFHIYYRKPHLEEVTNIQNLLLSLYEAFYLQYSTYDVIKSVTDETGRCNQTVPHVQRLNRELPPTLEASGRRRPAFLGPKNEIDEYWLKIVLKLRMAETKSSHDSYKLDFHIKEIISKYRIFGAQAALEYINDLTKGSFETNFLRKGSYWYGISQAEYEQRRRQAKEDAFNPLNVDFALTGTKNMK